HPYICFSFHLSLSTARRDLHSFPTRRSSDLKLHPNPRSPRCRSHQKYSHSELRECCRSKVSCGTPHQRSHLFGENIPIEQHQPEDRKSTRLNSSHLVISYAVFCLKKKKLKTASSQSVLSSDGRSRGQRQEHSLCQTRMSATATGSPARRPPSSPRR